MADLQIGNREGVAASGNQPTLLASVVADSVVDNVIEVDDVSKLFVGQVIDIVNKATGAELAVDRTLTLIEDVGGTLTVVYSGADVDPTSAHGLYPANGYAATGRSNINGGLSDREGYESDHMDTVAAMRARLVAINAAEYTAARLNNMTENDMRYAIRLADAPDTIKDI